MILAKLAPVLLALAYALMMYRFSVWRTGRLLDQKSHPLRQPEISALTRRMADALGLADLPVHVFEVDPVNGLAAPDGRIFLTRGFVQKYRAGEVSAEELASVIAHELGHVALGHTRRRMIDFTGANALFVMLTALLSRVVPFVGVFIANAISSALVARLSRRDEHEADAYASALLVKAGIGTEAQKSMFRKLARMTGSVGHAGPDWLRSHPPTDERIARIEEREARWSLAETPPAPPEGRA